MILVYSYQDGRLILGFVCDFMFWNLIDCRLYHCHQRGRDTIISRMSF